MRALFPAVVALLVTAMLSGCAGTEPQPQPEQRNYVLGAPICVAWVHDTIANSTADYQACKYNHRSDETKIEQCMIARGWRRETSERACAIKSYSYEQRQSCIRHSIVAGKVDHQLIARCLSNHTPKPAEALNQNALRNLIALCLSQKDQKKQEACLNQALNRK